MIDTAIVLARIVAWQRSNGGKETDLVVRQHQAVFSAASANRIPAGTCLPEQCWAQLTGKEEPFDLVDEYPEDRLDYSQTSRWNPNKSMDCSSWAEWNVRMWTGRSLVGPGVTSYTESQWQANKHRAVPWASRRPFDLVYWNFKQGRTASHVGILGSPGRLCHTTSPSNPLRIESDTWSASSRVGVVRILTDAEYASMFVEEEDMDQATFDRMADDWAKRSTVTTYAPDLKEAVDGCARLGLLEARHPGDRPISTSLFRVALWRLARKAGL